MRTILFESPVFFDAKVQDLNTELEALTWLQNQYPICRKGEVVEGTFPEVYYNSGSPKNMRVMPEGMSVSFFTIAGDITEFEEMDWTLPLSFYVWGDLTKMYPQKKYDYTGELVKAVIEILQKNSCNDLVITTDNVFSEFSLLEKQLRQNSMRPYTAFKISFTTIITKC